MINKHTIITERRRSMSMLTRKRRLAMFAWSQSPKECPDSTPSSSTTPSRFPVLVFTDTSSEREHGSIIHQSLSHGIQGGRGFSHSCFFYQLGFHVFECLQREGGEGGRECGGWSCGKSLHEASIQVTKIDVGSID